MKSLIALLCSLVVAVCSYAQTPGGATKSPPATKAATDKAEKKADATKKAPPKIEGMEVSRGENGFLGVQIVDGTFRINFYNVKKEPIAPNVARALLRWDPKNKAGQERLVLNPSGDGKALASSKPVAPPYSFKLFIVLSKLTAEGEDPAPETIVIDFRA